jgi:hypothetical protein
MSFQLSTCSIRSSNNFNRKNQLFLLTEPCAQWLSKDRVVRELLSHSDNDPIHIHRLRGRGRIDKHIIKKGLHEASWAGLGCAVGDHMGYM